ncbi:unnamed protein product [Hermetia illucens]|uniref:Uncharacterized protein n=1 Tax=Hermetia illucens TaxID=343691 RepID=A0A7R8UJ35_HERIL|nr:unnamed protein product [Hermetia illucens]
MSETIKHLEQNNGYLLELLQNQISIIDSTTNMIKETHKTVEKGVIELEAQHNTIKGINHEFYQVKIIEYFNTLAIRLILITAPYQKAQFTSLDVITGATARVLFGSECSASQLLL